MLVALPVVATLLTYLRVPGMAQVPDRMRVASQSTFPQRLSERFTSRDGLPAGRITRLLLPGDHGQEIVAVGEHTAAALHGSRWVAASMPRPATRVDPGLLPHGLRVLSSAEGGAGDAWIVTDAGAFHRHAGNLIPVTMPTSYLTNQQPIDVDAVLSCVATDRSGAVWFGSDAGIFATDGANWWNVIDRRMGLPYEDVTCLTFGDGPDLWVGTTQGVCRYSGGAWQYYWGPRWLPNNHVNAIAVASDGSAWVATDGGVARLYDRQMTLNQKAEHYEQITEARHNRYGFVTGSSLKTPGDPNGGFIHEASDNDGLWTAVYVGAQAFRYATTGSGEARSLARKSLEAMRDLSRYSGVAGFPARAIFRIGESVTGYDANETVRVRGETDRIWYTSPVDKSIVCKGDTSSDETDGHYFAYLVYYDLVADDAEKAEIRATVRALTDNILQHDYTLVGPTGRHTRWGIWSPQFLNDDPVWWEERGLNALEILTYLKVADHICGDARYGAAYRDLIENHHYLLNTVTAKVSEPWYMRNYSDDQMAFMMYYSILRLEHDPAIRLLLLQSLDRSWAVARQEASPFFNFVYGASTGRSCDSDAAVSTLEEWPWDLVDWRAENTQRVDVTFRKATVLSQQVVEMERLLPASERPLMRWNGNPFEPDGGDPRGGYEDDGSAWLLPYWLGRYLGRIPPPPRDVRP